jgi:hypothetical protein
VNGTWGRWAPLLGVPFAVLVVVGALVSGSTPDSDATAAHVVAWYHTHRGSVMTSTFLLVYALIIGVCFAAALRSYFRARGAGDGPTILGFGGALTLAIGGMVASGLSFAAADVPLKISPAAEQALNVAQNDVFFALLAGGFLFFVGFGLAILSTAALPRWLGWVAIPLGVLAVTPIGWIAVIFALPLWVLIVSVLAFLRQGAASSTAAPAPVAG